VIWLSGYGARLCVFRLGALTPRRLQVRVAVITGYYKLVVTWWSVEKQVAELGLMLIARVVAVKGSDPRNITKFLATTEYY